MPVLYLFIYSGGGGGGGVQIVKSFVKYVLYILLFYI